MQGVFRASSAWALLREAVIRIEGILGEKEVDTSEDVDTKDIR